MFPQVSNDSEKTRFDLDWLTKIVAMVCPITNYTADYVMYECSLCECFYFCVQFVRRKDDKNVIRRRNTD